MTIDAVAHELGMSVSGVRGWIRAGRLTPTRTDARGRYFFTRGQVAQVVTGTCPICGTVFQRRRLRKRFCSDACRKDSHRLHAAA